jgi:hypothetical protein
MAVAQSIDPARASSVARRRAARVLLLLITLLIVDRALSATAVYVVRMGTAGRLFFFFFGLGWGSFVPIALAAWLTWGAGRVSNRLFLVVGTVLVQCALTAGIQAYSRGEFDVASFVGWLLFTLAQILILHALAAPLQKLIGRELTFRTTGDGTGRQAIQWTLLDAVASMTFVAMALALIHLHSELLNAVLTTPEPLAHWLNFVTQSAPAVVAAPLCFWVVFGRPSMMARIALVLLAIVLASAVQQAFLLVLSGRLRLLDQSCAGAGVVASALVHFAAMRLMGLQWRRSGTVGC